MNKALIEKISYEIEHTMIDDWSGTDSFIDSAEAERVAEKILTILWEEGVLIHEEPSN